MFVCVVCLYVHGINIVCSNCGVCVVVVVVVVYMGAYVCGEYSCLSE